MIFEKKKNLPSNAGNTGSIPGQETKIPRAVKCAQQRKEKWKSLSRVRLFVAPWTIQSTEFSRPEYWSGYPFPSPGGLPNPGIEPSSPALQMDSLPAESQGKPKNTGVGSLSLLWGIFPTQELNWDLRHCRKILYQLICTKCAQKRKEGGHKKVTRRHGMIIHL